MKLFIATALSALLLAGAAQAASVTNNETSAQTIKILTGNAEQTFVLNPSDTITLDENLCAESCVLALQNGDEFEVLKADELVLEEGGVYMNPVQQGSAGGAEQSRQ